MLSLGRVHHSHVIRVRAIAIIVWRGYLGRVCRRYSRRLLLDNLPHLHLLVAVNLMDQT